MHRFPLAAAASVVAGLSIGTAATLGATTLAMLSENTAAATREAPNPSVAHLVQYGDRCYHGHCLPCTSEQDCLNKLPPALRP